MNIITNYNDSVMADVFISKVRPIGSSLGIIIPKEVVKQEHLESGKEIKVSIIHQNQNLLNKLFGSAKNAGPLERDHENRV